MPMPMPMPMPMMIWLAASHLPFTGVAPRIIYEIKVVLDELENSLLTIQRTASPLAQTFAINAPKSSDRVQSWPFRAVPRAFERSMEKGVEYNIHRVLQNPKQIRAEKHMERFEEKKALQEKMAQREAEKAEAKVEERLEKQQQREEDDDEKNLKLPSRAHCKQRRSIDRTSSHCLAA